MLEDRSAETTAAHAAMEAAPSDGPDFDVLIIGAGFGGMYALHKLRGAGFRVRVLEMADGVGGTWYWNRYPGARCDVESIQYSYSFSRDLEQHWDWSERYAAQPEILAYANHVADRFDLRRDMTFNTRVTGAAFDEATRTWRVCTDVGAEYSTRFLITAVGCLSTTNLPDFPDRELFRGPIYHTGDWPRNGVDFTGLRVAVIGTGSSGIQSIPVIAEQAQELFVFQRTPNFIVPARNRPLTDDERARVKQSYAELRAKGRQRPTGFYFRHNTFGALEVSDEERERLFDEWWNIGGLPFLGVFNDLLINPRSNEEAAAFVRRKIREVVKDPATAELLSPRDIIGCKRLCADTNYYETFNLQHVRLVDISKQPITRFCAEGVVVGETSYAVDAIVCATGFDAMTGTLLKLDLRGRGGLRLADKWEHGPRSYLGLGIAGFPNLFTITGPGSPSVFANMILAIEQHVDWIATCLDDMRQRGETLIEAAAADEDAWVAHNADVGAQSLRSQCQSWYLGSNVPGKPKVFAPYIGGIPTYQTKIDDIAADGFRGFRRS